jgi:hypothetical protein
MTIAFTRKSIAVSVHESLRDTFFIGEIIDRI